MKEIKDRIEHVLRAQNITATQLAEMMGIQRSGISHILSGRNNPSMDFIVKFKESFPEYNLEWLLLGDGPKTGYEQNRQQKLKASQPNLFESVDETSPKKEELPQPIMTEQRNEVEVQASRPATRHESHLEREAENKTATVPDEQLLSHKLSGKKAIRIALFFSDGSFEMYQADQNLSM